MTQSSLTLLVGVLLALTFLLSKTPGAGLSAFGLFIGIIYGRYAKAGK